MLSLRSGYQVVNYDQLTYVGNLKKLDDLADNREYSFSKGDICDPASIRLKIGAFDRLDGLSATYPQSKSEDCYYFLTQS